MTPQVVACPRLADLVAFIHRVLCERDALDPAQTPLFRTPLTRSGRACGLVFHVAGPRQPRGSAVWSAEEDRVLFYDSTGSRFREVRLSEGPTAEMI